MDQYHHSNLDPSALSGRVITNQNQGRIEIYDASGKVVQWIGNCGKDVTGKTITGTLSFDANGIPTMLQGGQQGGFGANDFGIKIAQPGFNVLTATADQLIMSTQFDLFKIVAAVSGSVTGINNSAGSAWTSGTAGNSSHYTYPHGLVDANGVGIVPTILTYADYVYGSTATRTAVPGGVGFLGALTYPFTGFMQVGVDATNVNITFISAPHVDNSANTVQFKFFLIRETAL